MISVIKYIDSRKVLVKHGEEFYIISESFPGIGPVETLVFRANDEGEVTSFCEITGEVGVSLENYLDRIILDGRFDAHMS